MVEIQWGNPILVGVDKVNSRNVSLPHRKPLQSSGWCSLIWNTATSEGEEMGNFSSGLETSKCASSLVVCLSSQTTLAKKLS